jgi:hypothetical protein
MLHIVLHFAVPALLAVCLKAKPWWKAYALLMLGLAVDIDHLLASPVYDPLRCGMGFHPLHTWPAVLVYTGLAVYKPTRLIGAGLLVHMLLDTLDCLGMPAGAASLSNFLRWPSWIQ